MARFAFRIFQLATISSVVSMLAPAQAAHVRRIFKPPATAYGYDGHVYDRFFSAMSKPRFVRNVQRAARDPRLRTLAAAPYVITDLTPIAGNVLPEPNPSLGIGYPSAVDNAGRIPYYDECGCVGDYSNDIVLEINDTGTFSTILYESQSFDGEAYAVPYGVSPGGNIAGVVNTYFGETGNYYEQMIAWLQSGPGYQSGSSDVTYALGINDHGVSVGSDTGAEGSFAARFSVSSLGAVTRKLLLPPKNTSWTGVATGINAGGEIVGYAMFPNNSPSGRAVRFFPTGYAQVIPVGAAGVSTSAQAINVHGDIVGSAGSRAFLYRRNRVAYLPLPPGESGDAVAYAINASDQVVGGIESGPSAFLYSGGRSYDLNALLPENSGWQIVNAAGINDAGQIVGVGYFAGEGGALVGFSMKPVPGASVGPNSRAYWGGAALR